MQDIKQEEEKLIYADNAATTRLRKEALEAMLPYFTEQYGNASTLYHLGRQAHRALEQARKTVANGIGAGPMELCFTSGGTESDNWAVRGTMYRLKKQGKTHLITSAIEHHAVLHSAERLEKEGFSVTYLPVTEEGVVRPENLLAAIRPETGLVSVMYANNETGVIQPVDALADICHKSGVLFHTDAVQAAGILPIDVKRQKIDLLSMSAHKFGGPKGIGALYIRRGALPENLLEGGGQERGHRSGTENVASAVGMAAAFSCALQEMEEKAARLRRMRDALEKLLLELPGSQVNGGGAERLPGTLNISFAGVDGQSLLLNLDLLGVAASSGSACNSGSMTPSHVLLAMGVPYRTAHGSLRLSFGSENREEEIPVIAEAVRTALARLA